MSKKVKSKSKAVSKSKPKKGSASSAKKAKKPVKKAAKKAVKAKVTVKKAIKKNVKAVAKKKVAKAVEKKAIKQISKTKVVAKPAPVVKPQAKEIKKVRKAEPPAKPVEKPQEVLPKNITSQNRPSVGRPIPVNRRPEPSKAVIDHNRSKEEPGKTRYSDVELEEFREIINEKLKNARKELATLQAQMTAANDHGTDDTASTFKILEDGSDSLAKEEAGQLASRQKKFIEQLENALVRIENKTYGVCRVTGKLIPKERLRAVPHTTQSIEAKLNQYRD
jgi:RNA polymerase-binding transcription factor DksA